MILSTPRRVVVALVVLVAVVTPLVLVGSRPADAKPLKDRTEKPGKSLRAFGPDADATDTGTTDTTEPTTTDTTEPSTTDTAEPTTTEPAPTEATEASEADCAPLHLSSDVRDYLQLAGDQKVVVPNGTYTGGAVTAPHPETDGPYGGWLILVAETPGQVVVDLSAAELNLQAGTSRIAFVGFAFENGRVRNHGDHIRYWYTTHTFPYDTWLDAGGPNGVHRTPKTMLIANATDIELYGATFSHVGDDGINLYKSSDIRIEGTTFSDINNAGHHSLIHADALQIQGRVNRLTVRQSILERQHIGTETNGDLVDLVWENSWFRDSRSAGITFAAKEGKDGTPLSITGSRTGIRSFGHSNGTDRHDVIDTVPTKPNANPGRINVVDTNVITEPPTPGTLSPVDVWRATNPYSGWGTLFS